ncbi:hypothetical protein BSIN_1524 [Burkholderia singularis]|uniref:Uncharacterized protein n=1 Tax=Burkholderia singularis TaxID=1503053 RepID=A0A238GZ61_9BURK|nr:hypothetical protein BSIN_1524 [Burkholderia singularis]
MAIRARHAFRLARGRLAAGADGGGCRRGGGRDCVAARRAHRSGRLHDRFPWESTSEREQRSCNSAIGARLVSSCAIRPSRADAQRGHALRRAARLAWRCASAQRIGAPPGSAERSASAVVWRPRSRFGWHADPRGGGEPPGRPSRPAQQTGQTAPAWPSGPARPACYHCLLLVPPVICQSDEFRDFFGRASRDADDRFAREPPRHVASRARA